MVEELWFLVILFNCYSAFFTTILLLHTFIFNGTDCSLTWLCFSVFQTVKAIEQFGAVVEELLIKHGKKIIGECLCLKEFDWKEKTLRGLDKFLRENPHLVHFGFLVGDGRMYVVISDICDFFSFEEQKLNSTH